MADGAEIFERPVSPHADANGPPSVAGSSAEAPAAAAAGSQRDGGEQLPAQGGAEQLLNSIERLKSEQAALRAQRKRVAKELKNAEKDERV